MIAAALATAPSILMLDEPVAGLTEAEGWRLIEYVEKVKATGVTIMLVEHVMSILMRVSDRVMIMHQGAKIYEGLQKTPSRTRTSYGSTGIAAGMAAGVQAGGPHA